MIIKINESKKRVNEELRNFTIVPYADEEAEDYTAETALDAIKDYKSRHRNDPHIYQVYDENDIYYDPETGEELVDESLKEGFQEDNDKWDQILKSVVGDSSAGTPRPDYGSGHRLLSIRIEDVYKVIDRAKRQGFKEVDRYIDEKDPRNDNYVVLARENEEGRVVFGVVYNNYENFADASCGYYAEEDAEYFGDSESLTEDVVKDWEVKQVSFDVAVPAGTDLNVQAMAGNTAFYKSLSEFLGSLGYEMAGDMINSEDMTDIYKSNDYEFFTESIKKESLARRAQTDSQEETLSFIDETARDLGLSLRYGTSVGKEPQTIILDHRYQDGAIRVSANGACEINGEWIGSYSDDYVDINDYEYEVTEALRGLLAEDED